MPIPKKPIRVPVKWEDGQWKAVLGNIEEIKPGALAELYIDRALFVDQARAGSGASADFRPEEGRHRADDGISRNIDPHNINDLETAHIATGRVRGRRSTSESPDAPEPP
jgi:hypothetical protein